MHKYSFGLTLFLIQWVPVVEKALLQPKEHSLDQMLIEMFLLIATWNIQHKKSKPNSQGIKAFFFSLFYSWFLVVKNLFYLHSNVLTTSEFFSFFFSICRVNCQYFYSVSLETWGQENLWLQLEVRSHFKTRWQRGLSVPRSVEERSWGSATPIWIIFRQMPSSTYVLLWALSCWPLRFLE